MKPSHTTHGNDWERVPMRGVAVAVVASLALFWTPLVLALTEAWGWR